MQKSIRVRLDKIAANFDAGAEVNATSLLENGIIDKVAKDGIKILGNGEVDKALNITATKFTKSAKSKIEAAGGSAIVQ